MALTDKLTAIANAIRAKTGKSTAMTLDEMPTEIASISGGGGITPTGTINISQNGTFDVTQYASALVNVAGGGGSAVTGTITPSEDSRSLTIPDIIGKSSVLIFPTSDLSTVRVRTHWGALFLNGRCILVGSSNSGGTAYVHTSAFKPSTTAVSNADTLDTTTGKITITAGIGSNYGGYFVPEITYQYVAW